MASRKRRIVNYVRRYASNYRKNFRGNSLGMVKSWKNYLPLLTLVTDKPIHPFVLIAAGILTGSNAVYAMGVLGIGARLKAGVPLLSGISQNPGGSISTLPATQAAYRGLQESYNGLMESYNGLQTSESTPYGALADDGSERIQFKVK
ncbi:MAG: hypothetical protein E6R05_03285 [Candidatus Moraniibacteriota bacterium]|nr:MAG: hypothetical protein E6R05_03285 [Candidatus Moranbacteria bacterium]